MSREEFEKLPDPKFKQGQYITDEEDRSFEISFVEWDFEKEEYNYFLMPDTYAGKIYEGNAELMDPPKHPSLETYELLFGDGELHLLRSSSHRSTTVTIVTQALILFK